MKFIDRVVDHPWVNERNSSTLEEIIQACEEHIEDSLKQLDIISEVAQISTKQIEVWKEMMRQKPEVDFSKQIEATQLFIDFFDVDARLLLIELDFLVAHKYTMLAKTDWEYRFFARRIYTLMHETHQGFLNPSGKTMNAIGKVVDERVYSNYQKYKKDLNFFFRTMIIYSSMYVIKVKPTRIR